MTSPIALSHISKTYDKKPVLQDISMELVEGEIFGLIGLNGAGKTTLIKILLNLTTATQGEAFCFGHSSLTVEGRSNLSYLPEKFQPPRTLKGTQYLELALSYYGKSFSLDAAKSKAAELDLDPNVLENRISSYSKGMGQKLGLAGAFLIESPLYILDEPMSGLDPKARILLKEELLRQKRGGKTVFFSSHILSDIDEICDRIGVIHGGRLVYLGTPAGFKKQYQNENLERAFLQAIGAASPVARVA